MRREAALPGGAFYSAKTWMGNGRLCPPNIDTPAKQIGLVKPKIAFLLELKQKKRTKALELSFTAFFLHTTGFDKNLRVVAPLCSEITYKTSYVF